MRLSSFLNLLARNLFQRPWRLALALFSLFAGSFFLAAALSASVGLPTAILRQIERSFPQRRLLVQPPVTKLLMLQAEGIISPSDAKKIEEIPGVAAVHRVAPLRVPVSARGDFLGNELQADTVAWGISEGLAADFRHPNARKPFQPAKWRTGEVVPAIIPGFFVDMYNNGFAVASGLPQINRDSAIGQRFQLLLNTTTLAYTDGEELAVNCEVVGVSDDVSLVAILIPLETAMEMNDWQKGAGRGNPSFQSLRVDLADLGQYDAVVEALRAKTFRVTGNRDLVATVRFLTLGGALAVAAVGVAAALMAAINLATLFSLLVMQRRGQIGLFCAIGGSRGLLVRLYLAEAAIVAIVGGGAGALSAWASLGWAEGLLFSVLPKLSFMPEGGALWLSPLMPLLVVASVATLCLLACLPPLTAALRQPPGEVVAGFNA